MNPTTIQHTKRQRITTKSGVELERSYVFMASESWEQLQHLCHAQGRSGSQVIASLISLAAIGNLKDKNEKSDRSSI
jgi:hypothetical protein